MGQLLPVLGNSRCGLKPPNSSVPMPSFTGEKHILVAPGESHRHLTFTLARVVFQGLQIDLGVAYAFAQERSP